MSACNFASAWSLKSTAASSLLALSICSTFSTAALAQSEEEYKRQVALLENRVARLESLVDRLSRGKGAQPAEDSRPKTAQGGPAPAAGAQAAGNAESKGSPGASQAASGGNPEPAKAPPPIADSLGAEDQGALKSLYAVRENAVTLNSGRWEFSEELNYTRQDGFLQTSMALGSLSSLRYGAGGGWEFGISVPLDWTRRQTQTGIGNPIVDERAYLGDVGLTVSKTILQESTDWPGIVASAAFGLPTGPSPYREGFAAGAGPADITKFIRDASGHYTATAGLEFFKTYSPFAFFAGANFTIPFMRDFGGVSVFPGYTTSFNLGTTVSLSERTSLGLVVLGSYRTQMETGGIAINGSTSAPISTAISVLHSLGQGLFVEPTIQIGLTDDAPNSVLTVKTRKTF